MSRKQCQVNKENTKMKKLVILLLLAAISQLGCAFLGGAATGALVTGVGYEINAKQQMDRLDEDFRNERITRREYEERKRQIEAGSIIY
jgi:Tfp pilus assembly protein PilO